MRKPINPMTFKLKQKIYNDASQNGKLYYSGLENIGSEKG